MVSLSESQVREQGALVAAIHEQPGDWVRYLVYADWLEERGWLPLASALRWMGTNHRRPHDFNETNRRSARSQLVMSRYPWVWTCEGGLPDALPHAGLPRNLCSAMGFHEWRAFATWDEAVDALAVGLEKVKPRQETRPVYVPSSSYDVPSLGD